MKIISNFTDFYDQIQQYGIDNKIVYNRVNDTRQKFDNSNQNNLFCNQHTESTRKLLRHIDTVPVYTDDTLTRLYNLLWNKIYDVSSNNYHNFKFLRVICCINCKVFKNYILIHDNKIIKFPTVEQIIELIKLQSFYKNAKILLDNIQKKQTMTSLEIKFSLDEKLSNIELINIHKEFNSPVIIVTDTGYFRHAPMSFFGFNRIYDGNIERVAQEISYCIGNILNNQNEPPLQVSNTVKLEQHGFDKNVSFRKRTGI